MKIRTMLGLAAVGGFLYYHRQRGGEWTLESVKDTGRHLLKSLEAGGERAKKTAREAVDDAARKADKLASSYKH